MFGIDARKAVLVDDEHALAVADVEQGGSDRIMRRTVGITAEFLQSPDAPLHQSLGDGRTYPGVILVHVHAL